jgi:predicted RNA binding protein YcfA (HicA-like mRNA interferase family)
MRVIGGGGGRAVGKDSRDIIRELEADGWVYIGATGSHHHFKHPAKPGKVTVPHPRRDLHPKTVRSIYRQAALQEKR